MKRHVIFSLAVLAALIFIFGCAPRATIKSVSPSKEEQRAAFEKLINEPDKYAMYVFEWNKFPAALLIDPKEDEKVLRVSEQWKRIANEAELRSAIDRSQVLKPHLYPSLYAISGPDGKVWGYIASYATQLNVKLVDDRTMLVYGPPPPKQD